MSDDFLARWSRRKRDVAEAEQAKSDAPGEIAPSTNATSIEPRAAVVSRPQAEPVFDLKSLPSIDQITAATDIRPFLAKGVPVDIARAALRRAWAADPQIRDFVGLADYDWDYHAAGSAAGFGPLEMTDELRRAVARILGEVVDEGDEAGRPGRSDVRTNSPEGPSALGGETEPTALAQDSGRLPAALGRGIGRGTGEAESQKGTDDQYAAARQRAVERGFESMPARRGHGRALPK